MRAAIAIAFLAALASANLAQFRTWANFHNKFYTGVEEQRRLAIFKENMAIAERLNLENHGAKFGKTQFMDLTNAEFKALYTTNLGVRAGRQLNVLADKNANDFNWTDHLPAVKNQASCGSCWAFSAVANAEGVWAIANGGKVTALSEQQVVSCDKQDSACNGGWMTTADQYIIDNGLSTEASYPYTSATGKVAACKKFTPVATFSSFVDMGEESNDQTIIDAIDDKGPLSVAIEADKSVFQMYTTGVLDSTACGTSLNHGVTLVGYGTDKASQKKFWLVRNSWGATWGEAGYIRMVRGKNMCGINSAISTIVA